MSPTCTIASSYDVIGLFENASGHSKVTEFAVVYLMVGGQGLGGTEAVATARIGCDGEEDPLALVATTRNR